MSIIEEIMKFQKTRSLDKQAYSWENEFMNILEEILEERGYSIEPGIRENFLMPIIQQIRINAATSPAIKWDRPTEHDMIDAAADQIVFNIGKIMKLGYDPRVVLIEVAKEINSRCGSIKNGKFVKHMDSKSIDNWYKADFTKAKV